MSARNVLIVEEDEDLASLLVSLCGALGFEPRASTDGLHAILSVIQQRPDLVHLDANLPSVGSRSVAEMMARDGRFSSVPIARFASRPTRGAGLGRRTNFSKPCFADREAAS